MSEFCVKPIDEALAHAVRATLRDPIYDLPLHVEPATGYGPCRLCLRTFEPGEPRILFLYNPFSGTEQEADFAGPVFIHAGQCDRFAGRAFPPDVAGLPIVLHAYDQEGRRVIRVEPPRGEVSTAIGLLLASEGVAYVHVRNAEAKCFIARVERVATAAAAI